jgi:hypothetical protein
LAHSPEFVDEHSLLVHHGETSAASQQLVNNFAPTQTRRPLNAITV